MAAGPKIDISYDDVPYPDVCHPYTHPGRLAAIAAMANIEPAPPARCRVLDVGCAGGGNLVPMAFGLPESTFVGLDLSPRQIESARTLASSLDLHNVEFLAMDLTDVSAELGTFDYIVAHGMYSWVPGPERDAILAICRNHLAPTGVAYISYNTLPGWHMLLMVREMMLFHVRDVAEPRARAREARAFVTRLQSMIPDSDHSAFASFLAVFVESRIGRFDQHDSWDESALLHDELSAVNEPVYFHQFIEHARQHGLQYLADAQSPQQRTQDLSADAIAQLHELGRDRLAFEQYLDHVLQQTFRRTLLCHEELVVRSTPDAADLTDLYVGSRARLVGDDDGAAQFVADDGSTFISEHPLTTAALRYLHEVSPRAVHFPLLLDEARRRAGTAEPEDTARTTLSSDLLRAATCSHEQAELLGDEPILVPVPSERPLASPVARRQMHRSQYVATLRHEQIELTGLSLAVVPLLDGRRTRPDLLGELMTMVDDGRLRNSRPDVPRPELERQLSQALETTLGWLGRAGLLLA